MNRKHLYLLIDTETANGLDDPIVYNFAAKLIDRNGNSYLSLSAINRDIFFGTPDLMNTAYYANKIPQYLEQIASGECVVMSWYEIKRWVWNICEQFNVKAVIAHNARFDYRSCSCTQRFETSSQYRYFFPKDVEIWDTLAMARDVLSKRPTYQKWCAANGYTLKNGQPRLTAEIIYRFITNDNEFVEEHKAMEDVNIECEIFWYLTSRKKAMRRKCFKD